MQPKHQFINDVILMLNPKHGTVLATKKKMICVAAETRIRSYVLRTGKKILKMHVYSQQVVWLYLYCR